MTNVFWVVESYVGRHTVTRNNKEHPTKRGGHGGMTSASERQRAECCHRRGPKTVPAQTTNVIFIVFFKFYIKSAGGDGKFVVVNRFQAF